MSKRRPPIYLLRLSMLFMTLNSACLFIIPRVTAEKRNTGHSDLLLLMAGAFWLTTLLAYTMLLLLNRARRKRQADARSGVKTWGFFHLFSNIPALLMDELMLISLTGFLLLAIIAAENSATFVFFALLFFSIQMHGLLNGENYRWCRKRGKYQKRKKQENNNHHLEGSNDEKKDR